MSDYTLPPTAVTTPLPAGSWDTHFHVFPDSATLHNPPFQPFRIPVAKTDEYHAALGIQNTVLVQSYCFGTDLSSLHEYVDAAPGRRGIACLSPSANEGNIDAEEVTRLNGAGIRGVRAQPTASGPTPRARQIISLAKGLDKAGVRWNILVQEGDPAIFDSLVSEIDSFPTSQNIVIDHLGVLPGPWSRPNPKKVREVDTLPYVKSLLELLSRPNVWIKLSSPFRITSEEETLEPLIKAIVGIAKDRITWASDWPFTPLGSDIAKMKEEGRGGEVITLRVESAPKWLELLRGWLGEEAFVKMMVDNPKRLYA